MSIIGDGIVLGSGGKSASIFATGLSETDTVWASSANLNPEWKVPNGYTQLEYIESSGTQYIDTGVLAKDITNSFIDFQFVSTGSTELEVMATYVNSTNKMQCGWSGSTFMTNSGATYSYLPETNIVSTVRNLATVVPVGSPAYTVYLFAQNEKDAVKWQCSAKIYSCKISTSSGMVRDFVPAKRNSDGTVGLYDSINDLFYTNSGTDTFIAGKKVQQYIDVYEPEYSNLPEAYSQLEYIESSGTQYIDTGVVLDSTNLTGTIDFQITTDPTGNDQWVSGAMNSGYTIGIEGGVYRNFFFTTLGFDYSQTYNLSARTTASFSVTSGMTNEFTLLLFGRNVGGNRRAQFTGRIYSAKIRNGSTMLRNFIPAKRNTDSVLGLYDLVNGVFYTNGGDGEFIAGPVYKKKLVNGKWSQWHNPAFLVPDGYVQLESIKSTGTQYINSGIIPSNDLVAHFTNFSASGNTVNYSVFLGSQTQDNANDSWEFRIHPTNGKYLLDIYGQTRVQADIVQNCDIVLDKSGVTINGTKTTFSTTPSTISATYPLWIFASNTGGSAFRPSNASFSSLTLSDENGLLRNYVPAKRVTDGEIGLYDLVSRSFFVNSGTGTFTAGAEIPQYIAGFEISPINSYGLWGVNATNGTVSKTVGVLVDSAIEYSVELDYKTWLYKEGNEYSGLTGGWSADGYTRTNYNIAAGTKEVDSLNVSRGSVTQSYTTVMFGTQKLINISNFSKLCIDYWNGNVNAYNPKFAISTSKVIYETTPNYIVSEIYGSNAFSVGVRAIYTIDISELTDPVYVFWASDAMEEDQLAYRIWLE